MIRFLSFVGITGAILCNIAQAQPSLILHHGKIITVDKQFAIQEAIAIRGETILKVGSNQEILALKVTQTEMVDLKGKTVVPGLIDSHSHPLAASLVEFDHEIPQMDSVQDVLSYFAARAKVVPEGQWLKLRQVFITRLREQRYPTRAELDQIAPKHPVIFATGPDAMLNSLALKLNKIDRNFKVPEGGPGFVEKDPQSGEPTGLCRTYARYVKVPSTGKEPGFEDKKRCLARLFQDYNCVGITTVCERDADPGQISVYQALRDSHQANMRVALSYHISTEGSIESIQDQISQVTKHPLYIQQDPMLKIIGVKVYLDGGMLTGSAYLRQPWGVSQMYGITDPNYRGVLFIPPDRLSKMAYAAIKCGLQFTAHSVGDGAVHALLDAYETISKELPLSLARPCIEHANFMSHESVEQAARLGVMLDIQPAWLYLDTRTLMKQFGYERMRYFQPLQSIFKAGGLVGGGSDHMQKIGSIRSNNPYNPFLGMATAISRKARWYEGRMHPEEALTREQALRFYTINNARILFMEKLVGSLEAGKLADFLILDRDLLECDEDKITSTQVLTTYFNGKRIYQKE
jgi:predicted amidohydrolase YtcJ